MTETPGTLDLASVNRPKPLGSLVASAKRITAKTLTRTGSNSKGWQEDAWEMYDLVGEERFLASTLAGRLAQARFYIGKVSDEPLDPPEPVEDDSIASILEAMGSSASARAQMILRLGINLFVAGDGWLVGVPRALMPSSLLNVEQDDEVPLPERFDPFAPDDRTLSIEDLEWRMLSVSEVSSSGSGEITLSFGEDAAEKVKCSPDDVWLIRVWRPHPRKWWEADSPTRSSLPVLRELVGLTMHISAQVDSRLAGAGLLIVPQSAQRAVKQAAGLADDDESDPFTDALMEAMLTPISDRANASAMVPLVITVPDESTDKFNYMTFAKPLDSEARSLRDEAIRRLALGQDAPPELLLGSAGMNHWGAWLVQEEVVTTHLEPPLALICDAITTQYLWPVLIDQGMTRETAEQYVVWYDVSHLIMRPNRAQDAKDLNASGAISDEALRDATGFSEADAPQTEDPDLLLVLDLVRQAPTLAVDPGLPALLQQVRDVRAGNTGGSSGAVAAPDEAPTEEDAPPDGGSLPPGDSDSEPPADVPPEAQAASALPVVTGLKFDPDEPYVAPPPFAQPAPV